MLLAHTSDWSGMVLVLIALAFFAWLLHLANRRATKAGLARSAEPAAPEASNDPEP